MTKEEFNKKWPMSKIPDVIRQVAVAWGDAHDWFIADKVKLAQDILEATDKHISEYTKQRVLNFMKWRDDQPGNPQDGSVWWWGLSHEQQYSMFLEDKANK